MISISPPSSPPAPPPPPPLKVTFIHLDLGIGGAEALVVSLAQSLLPAQSADDISIYTTRCYQNHCFSQVKKGSSTESEGCLASCVELRGEFIPSSVFGRFTALLSNLRSIYLSFCIVFDVLVKGTKIDVVVVDVLPSPMMVLWSFLPSLPILYYCHFPDKLLVRNTINGVVITKPSLLRSMYRYPLDKLEEYSTSFADLVVVNSKFTAEVFREAFVGLNKLKLEVLYPSINLEDFLLPANPEAKRKACETSISLLSLNRFERKKNIGLALEMMNDLRRNLDNAALFGKINLVIAGGYDVRNAENVEYLEELKSRCSELKLDDSISFRPSISDSERAMLLSSSLCLIYTPHREHFGIVPLEAMYAGVPVVAVASGGPLETVVHEKTGFLCENDSEDFAKKVEGLVRNVGTGVEMGKAGHEHVKDRFGRGKFKEGFRTMLVEAKERRLEEKIAAESAAGIGFLLFLLLLLASRMK